jgi:hypothetical protein
MNRLIIFLLEIKIERLFKKSSKLLNSIKDTATEEQIKEYSMIHKGISRYYDAICSLNAELNKDQI